MSKTLIINSAIVLAVLILGGSFYAVQVNKQQSIERQQQIAFEAEEKAIQNDKILEELKKTEKREGFIYCSTEAEKNFLEDWSAKCELLGRISEPCLRENVHAKDMFNIEKNKAEPYETEHYEEYFTKLNNHKCSCVLSYPESNLIRDRFEKLKNECYRTWDIESGNLLY